MHPDPPIIFYAIKIGFYWAIYKLATGSMLGIWLGIFAIMVNIAAIFYSRHAFLDHVNTGGLVLSTVYSMCLIRSLEFRQVGYGPGLLVAILLSLLVSTLIIRGAAVMTVETYLVLSWGASFLGVVYFVMSYVDPRPRETLCPPVHHEGLFSLTHGMGPLKNIHFWFSAQRWAKDFFVYEHGKNIGDGLQVVSPVQGKVERVAVDSLLGQHMVLSCLNSPGRFVLIAHLREGSVVVQAGEMVHRETPLGLLGNSGNSSEPHIHMQVQDGPDFGSARTLPYCVQPPL